MMNKNTINLVKLMIDEESFNDKKSAIQSTGKITKRIVNHVVEIDVEEFAEKVASGKTFCPGICTKQRKRDYWTGQQVICLDFDNEREVGSGKNKKRIKHVTMSVERAIDEFKNDAAFIYSSFNHKKDHPKIRVVIIFDKIIDDVQQMNALFNYYSSKYPDADKKCFDLVRIFYGGKSILWNNYSNRLSANNILQIEYDFYTDTSKNIRNIRVINKSEQYKKINNFTIVPTYDGTLENKGFLGMCDKNGLTSSCDSNIGLIKARNIKELRSLLSVQSEVIEFYTAHDLKSYLFSRNLFDYLGINKNERQKFSCVFHKDTNPSANIIMDNEQNRFIYFCYSSNCELKSGLIIKITEKILGCDNNQALSFLSEVYNIQLKETEWQKKKKEEIDNFKLYIVGDEFPIEYPELYKRIKNYIGDYDALLDIARLNMPPEYYTEEQLENLFFVSVRFFAKRIGRKSLGQVANELGLFVYLGLINKLTRDKIPKIVLDRAENELKKNREKFKTDNINMVSFFSVPKLSYETLNFGEKKAIEFKEKNMTMKGWSREMIERNLGSDEVKRIFLNDKTTSRKISDRSHMESSIIERVMLRMLNEDRKIKSNIYITEKYVVNTIMKNYQSSKNYTERKIKRIIGEVLEKYDLVRVRLNKELSEKIKFDGNGYPYVILKRKVFEQLSESSEEKI